jgi:very-short-patch-repair endonuclease
VREGRISIYFCNKYVIIKNMNRHYLRKSLNNAKDLRSNQTDCENILWNNIRAKRLNNIKFRRQVPIGKYIVDFINLHTKLIIELDGSQHIEEKNIEYDNIRKNFLNKNGYTIIRFFNNEIIENLDNVLNVIVEEYEKLVTK